MFILYKIIIKSEMSRFDRIIIESLKCPEAEFKEFDPRLKFKPRLKYGWFHLKLNSIFEDLNRRSIETGFWQI